MKADMILEINRQMRIHEENLNRSKKECENCKREINRLLKIKERL